MAFVDYYKILGVDKSIAQQDVKKAYLKRAKLFHPDLHPDDPKAKAKFQALNEAYEVIGDPEKRRKYDQYGENWRNAEAFGGGAASGSPFDGFQFSGFSGAQGGFSSFFESLFGQAGSRHRHEAPEAQQASVDIDLYTALLGGEVIITLPGDATRLRLKVKPCTQPGQKVRLRGKGPGRQDLIIQYNVTLPKSLTAEQELLVRRMKEM